MIRPFATAQDLANLWRPLTVTEQSTADYQLELASALLRGRKSLKIDDRIAAGKLDPNLVKLAVCQMVERKMRNVDGFNSEADGDYNYTVNSSVASGKLVITSDETDLLQPTFTGNIRSRAGLADLGNLGGIGCGHRL